MITIGSGTGSAADILGKVKKLIPHGWFQWVAPYRDALLGGLADLASWNYYLVSYARAQSRLATAYGIWLDILAYDFLGNFLMRNKANDDTFRALIRATILQERVTRAGMVNAVTAMTGTAPTIFEPWNTYDTGAYSSPPGVGVPQYGSFGYNVGQGGYGNMQLNNQVFLGITRGSGSGVPNVDGYGGKIAGYGAGTIEYVGLSSELWGTTDAMIYQLINMTKPTGTTAWVAFLSPIDVLISEAGVVLTDESSTNKLTSTR